MHPRIIALASAFVALGACHDATAPVDPTIATEGRPLASAEVPASLRWARLTRQVLARREPTPTFASRTIALVTVAAYNAAVAAAAAPVSNGLRPSEAGAVAGAAAAVLRGLYAMEDTAITAQLLADRSYFATQAGEAAYDFAAGELVGAGAASRVLTRAAADRSSSVWSGTVPVGPQYWVGAPAPAQPVTPQWGQVRGWSLTSNSQFRPAPPPEITSSTFSTDLAEVRALSIARTPAQLAIAQFWQSPGPGGPPGYFLGLADSLSQVGRLNERRTARALAVTAMAMADALIGCWDAKFTYMFLRPYNADASIATPVGRPNHPSYPSAHSCVTAAAAGVLTDFFPTASASLAQKVEEAGLARIWVGLHYRFDITAGQSIGSGVAALTVSRRPAPSAPIPID